MRANTNERTVQTYLVFGGRCEEAIGFYQKVLGAQVDMIARFKECPEPNEVPNDWKDKIMHSSLRIGKNTFMASDGCWQEKHTGFQGFSLSLSVTDEAEADRLFAAISDRGEVRMPMEKTFFARRFGMTTDRFGVSWMVIVPAEECVPSGKLETAMA